MTEILGASERTGAWAWMMGERLDVLPDCITT